MATASDFKRGDTVKFLPNWRSTSKVTAKVTGKTEDRSFLITKDGDGNVRRVRPGACIKLG